MTSYHVLFEEFEVAGNWTTVTDLSGAALVKCYMAYDVNLNIHSTCLLWKQLKAASSHNTHANNYLTRVTTI